MYWGRGLKCISKLFVLGAGPKICISTLFVLGAGPKIGISTIFVLSVNRGGPWKYNRTQALFAENLRIYGNDKISTNDLTRALTIKNIQMKYGFDFFH